MSAQPVADQRDLLERFAARVATSPHNLVSRSARAELLDRHVPECVALAHLLPPGPGRLLDLGSGGGFPGMVVAIARPDLEVHLLDATRKKTTFLREVAADLGVRVDIHTGRAEELQRGPLGGSFDLVTARAVAALDRLLPWAVPFLRPGGLLYALKGARWREELEEAQGTVGRARVEVVATPEDLGSVTDDPSRPTVLVLRAPNDAGKA